MKVSVVMRSKNCDWVIGEALAALRSQTVSDFELLVVDSGSTDRSLELSEAYSARVLEIPPDDYHPGNVLNRAMAETTGDVVVFQNADAVPLSPNSLANLLAAFDGGNVAAAFGRQLPRPDAELWVSREYKASFPDSNRPAPWIVLSFPFAAVRRSAWLEHPFYSDCWGSEDTEWGAWALRAGWRVKYVPNAIVMHSHNYSLRQIWGRRFIEGEADAYVCGGRPNIRTSVRSGVAACWKDVKLSLQLGSVRALCLSPVRRIVGEWGEYRGRKLGTDRLLKGCKDSRNGQRVVMANHESVVTHNDSDAAARTQ
ncbi:MAG: glycosyltransferase family 2 protein [Polyangiaceae bacterium]|nr:glycosyltransferase family 2 protein [Polyangiaceae bacterium]